MHSKIISIYHLSVTLLVVCLLHLLFAENANSSFNEDDIDQKKTTYLRIAHTIKKKSLPMVVSAITDRVIFHPMETIITLQQSKTYAPSFSEDFIKCTLKFYRQEGFTGLYKGFFWPTLTSIPNRFIVFGTYFSTKDLLRDESPFKRYLASGLVASLIKAIVSCPPEAYRTRKVCGIKVYPEYSLKILFRGLIPLSLKHVSGLTPTLGGTDYILYEFPEIRKQVLGPFFVSGVLSFLFQTIATPADALKTRVMEDYSNGILFHMQELWKDRTSIYKTFLPRAARSSAGAAVTLGVLHLMMSNFNEDYESDYK